MSSIVSLNEPWSTPVVMPYCSSSSCASRNASSCCRSLLGGMTERISAMALSTKIPVACPVAGSLTISPLVQS
jgi:hypothetical protein